MRAGGRLRPAWLLGAVLALGGCAGTGPAPSVAPPPAPAAPPTADQRAAAPAALVAERQWLQAWFKGTPVQIAQLRDGTVTIDVPRSFCFDPGNSSVKPPLGAVLDKVAESLRRMPVARLALLAAPDDAAGTSAPLALQRAAALRSQLLARGVAQSRLASPTAATPAAVQLRIVAAAR